MDDQPGIQAVTGEAERLRVLERCAGERTCEHVSPTSGHWRDHAHRCYENRIGVDRTSHSFRNPLGNAGVAE